LPCKRLLASVSGFSKRFLERSHFTSSFVVEASLKHRNSPPEGRRV
jgi:hypothetical protein